MKLSICILTHKRPLLFKRCINSVLNNLPDYNIEILVNNDSNDIEEISSNNISIKYYYNKYNDLSKIYKFLFDSSRGDYIYFIEDDDYILPSFFKRINYNYDVNYFEYFSKPHMSFEGKKIATKRQKINRKNKKYDLKKFLNESNFKYFQLSQICFNKKRLNKFPLGNKLDNDLKLFKNIDKNSSFLYIDKPCWVQTIDGGDNISFDNLNKDSRFDNKKTNDLNI